MKIKNEYIKIKTSSREFNLKNLIFDDYLKYFFQRQYDSEKLSYYNSMIQMSYCFIKFDEPLKNIIPSNRDERGNCIITEESFDISITVSNIIRTGNDNSTSTIYDYTSRRGIYDYSINASVDDINQYAGRKITAIGFGYLNNIFACVDTSNYSVYMVQDEELNISRKDVFSSDAICKGSDYPVHLATAGDLCYYESGKGKQAAYKYAMLYSVGFGKTIGKMDEEYVINEDIQIIKENDYAFGFDMETGTEEGIYPSHVLYCDDELYPLPFYVKAEVYPRENFYLDDMMYPSDSNYKYVIYKYRLCYWPYAADSPIYLDEYYTMNLENSTRGLFEMITKIERA